MVGLGRVADKPRGRLLVMCFFGECWVAEAVVGDAGADVCGWGNWGRLVELALRIVGL